MEQQEFDDHSDLIADLGRWSFAAGGQVVEDQVARVRCVLIRDHDGLHVQEIDLRADSQ
jgi:hypothetical protein